MGVPCGPLVNGDPLIIVTMGMILGIREVNDMNGDDDNNVISGLILVDCGLWGLTTDGVDAGQCGDRGSSPIGTGTRVLRDWDTLMYP